MPDFYVTGRRRTLSLEGEISINARLVVRQLTNFAGLNVVSLDEGKVWALFGSGGETKPYRDNVIPAGNSAYVSVASGFRTRFLQVEGGTKQDWWITLGADVVLAGGAVQFVATKPEVFLGRWPDVVNADLLFDWDVAGSLSLLYNLEEIWTPPLVAGVTPWTERARPDSPGLFSVSLNGAASVASAAPPAWNSSYEVQIAGYQRSDSSIVGSPGLPHPVPYTGRGGTASFNASFLRTAEAATAPPAYSYTAPAMSDGLSPARSPGSTTQISATAAAATGREDPDASFPNPTISDTTNYLFFRSRARPAETIEVTPRVRNFGGEVEERPFRVELTEGNEATPPFATATSETPITLTRGPFWQHRTEARVGANGILGSPIYDEPAGNWPTVRTFGSVAGRCAVATSPIPGHESYLAVKDSFTGPTGSNLTAHVGEVGASWSIVPGTGSSATNRVRLNGAGGVYPIDYNSQHLQASGSGPGTSAVVTFALDSKTFASSAYRLFVFAGDNFWRIGYSREQGFPEGWSLTYGLGASIHGRGGNTDVGARLVSGPNNQVRVEVEHTGGNNTACRVYLTNSNVTDLLVLSADSTTITGRVWEGPIRIRIEAFGNSLTPTTGVHLRNLIASVESEAISYDQPIPMTGYGRRYNALTLTQPASRTAEGSPWAVGAGNWVATNCTASVVEGKLRVVVGALGVGQVAKVERGTSLSRRFGYRHRDVKVRTLGSADRPWRMQTGKFDEIGNLSYRLRYVGTTGDADAWVTRRVDLVILPAAPPTYPEATADGALGTYDRLVFDGFAANTTYEFESVVDRRIRELFFHRELNYTAITSDGALVVEPTGSTLAALATSINANPERGLTAAAVNAVRPDKPATGAAPEATDAWDAASSAGNLLGNGLVPDGEPGVSFDAAQPIPAWHLWQRIGFYPGAGHMFKAGTDSARGYGEPTKFVVGILLRGAVYGLVAGGGSHVAGAALPQTTVFLTGNDTGAEAGDGDTEPSGYYSTGEPGAVPGFAYRASLAGGVPPFHVLPATGAGSIARARRVYLSFLWAPEAATRDLAVVRDYTLRLMLFFTDGDGHLICRAYQRTEATFTDYTVDDTAKCAYPNPLLDLDRLICVYRSGENTPRLAVSRTHGRTWNRMNLPGAYDAVKALTQHRRLLYFGFKDASKQWFLTVGRPQADGTYSWSAERLLPLPASPAPTEAADVETRSDESVGFYYLDASGATKRFVGRAIGLNGIGDWR